MNTDNTVSYNSFLNLYCKFNDAELFKYVISFYKLIMKYLFFFKFCLDAIHPKFTILRIIINK